MHQAHKTSGQVIQPIRSTSEYITEGGRSGPSDELSKVLDAEKTTTQLTWMPRDNKSSGKIHEVANSHEEAAGDDSDKDGEVKRSMDESTAATTANASTDASTWSRSQPSMPPEWQEGHPTTGNAGACMHQPNGAQTGSP